MVVSPVIIVLGPSALAVAQRLKQTLGGSEIHGLAQRVGEADVVFDDAPAHIRTCFAAGHPVVGICASGILVRAVAPALADKHSEPPVIAVAEDGSCVVPLLGGHNGGNDLARAIARCLAVEPAITTAGDVTAGVALDAPPVGWTLANPRDAKVVMADILSGEAVRISDDLTWLKRDRLVVSPDGPIRLSATIERREPGQRELVYHPRRVVVGVGTDRGCPPDELIDLVESSLRSRHVAPQAVACVVSLDRKADEAAVHALAAHLGVPARFLSVDAIHAVADRIPNPSEIVLREVGVPGVAEGAALAASGAARLLAEKMKTQRATCAIAVADEVIRVDAIGRARGCLAIVGIGPGTPAWRSREATGLLRHATDWVGYGLYLDLVADLRRGQSEHRFDLGAEEDRVRHALALAGTGRDVALVCSGDAGIYAMATLVFELMSLGEEGGLSDGASRCEIVVAPGISAVQAAAARAGAPIGHDFCCISLSDLLTPWPAIERRVRAAAEGDFVVAFYNPRSRRRRDQIEKAMAILGAARPADTPVIIAANLGRTGESLSIVALSDFNPEAVDMLSIVIVGASSTRTFQAGDGRQIVFTPRGYAAKREVAA